MKGTAEREGTVLVIGHSCLDSIAVTEAIPPADGKLEAQKIWIGAGGPAANAAIALRRLGHRVRLASRLATDDAGSLVRARLLSEGIELLEAPVDGASTSLAQIRARGQDRSVVWKRGQMPVLPHDADTIHGWMEGVDLLYVDGHEVAAASTALALAESAGIAAIADAGSLRPGAEDWPARLDSMVTTPRWLASRYPELPSLVEAVRRLAADARGGALVGVTLGAHGGLAHAKGGEFSWRARKTGAVDTTGAGDAFHAGLADALLQGLDAAQALDWAATLAAAVCRSPGNQSLPADRDQLALWHGRWGHRPQPDEAYYRLSPAAV